jgi:hypothetical protein
MERNDEYYVVLINDREATMPHFDLDCIFAPRDDQQT